ncbi:uncharacterized protein LOC122633034 [Vespula pensylvanica]|uniref:Uncharacterized protein n=1 Tax=Vespula pensylvanica TaxID=30213 RepID=A0A834NQT3_VESPE|nr:uncharacterized protein LOC122633034 [Vespula pensylvanica]KAF7415851.1 hypothetical protein H0235_012443 [Vespula pensylvanica]
MRHIIFKFLWLIIIPPLVDVNTKVLTTTESSADYLQKVMLELQQLHSPTTPKTYVGSTGNLQSDNLQQYNQNQNYSIQNHLSETHQFDQIFHKDDFRNSKTSSHKKIDLQHSGSENIPQYYEIRSPTYVSAANLKDSRLFAELAAIYKNALNKGPFISVSSSSNSDKRPQIVETHLELPVRQPAYHHYYFFPLKTIENEINKNDEHHLMSTYNIDNVAESASHKQLSNPLFIAISTFVSIAVLFMMGILFLPKLHQYGIFSTRGIQDDFLYLTNIVMGAIDKFED